MAKEVEATCPCLCMDCKDSAARDNHEQGIERHVYFNDNTKADHKPGSFIMNQTKDERLSFYRQISPARSNLGPRTIVKEDKRIISKVGG